jgi:uncharacterized protein (TIGR02680 family)
VQEEKLTTQLNLDIFGTNGTASGDEDVAAKVDYLQTLEGGTEGYRLRRIILCNFWLYGLQEFEIAHGRLFLAGENASGKSSVLAAALPLALDGDRRPNRLDTFGGRERKLDYYVLGGTESATAYSYERRTTYIALEFEWCNPDQPPLALDLRQEWLEGNAETREKMKWFTIGISLAGNANATEKIRPLYFAVTDGARFGHEIFTVDSKNIALDHANFKRIYGSHFRFFDTVSDYQQFVARNVFGMEDSKELTNLTNMMLVLRKPNLGSEINFSKVHDYLKQSLRKIPEEITRRVTGTIERIDNIQSQLEHLQSAMEAGNRLDSAVQRLATAWAKKTALAFSRSRRAEITAQQLTTRYTNDLKEAERERAVAQSSYDELMSEDSAVNGQIAALESSEGLQTAEKLAQAREAVAQAQLNLSRQTEQLENARNAVQAARMRQKRLSDQWQKFQTENRGNLAKLKKSAQEKVAWDLAVAQLDEVEAQVRDYRLESETAPTVPNILASLAGMQSADRIGRLRALEELHREREAKAVEERIAREREEEKLAEYDDLRRKRENAASNLTESREKLASELRQLYRESRWVSELPDYRLSELITAILRSDLEEYRTVAAAFAAELERSATRLKTEQSRLLEKRGGQLRQQTELEARYRQKLNETDLTPLRSASRQTARNLLTEKGIKAFPLYALVDFAPDAPPEIIGKIERMLESAGLLDALIIEPEKEPAANLILEHDGLADAWLTPAAMVYPNLSDFLKFDAQALENDPKAWKQPVLAVLESIAVGNGTEAVYSLDFETGNWQSGLLVGQSGTGNPTGYIGTANRRRLRREQLEILEKELEQLKNELEQTGQKVQENAAQQQELTQEQTKLNYLAQADTVFTAEAELSRAETERAKAEKNLNEVQERAKSSRQQLHALTTRLLQESEGLPGASDNPRRVRDLLDETITFQNNCNSLLKALDTAAEKWAEYAETAQNLASAAKNEQTAAQLHAESLANFTQIQAELTELERLSESADVQDLLERLTRLRVRLKELPGAIRTAYAEMSKADQRITSTSENLAQAQSNLAEAQQERTAAETIFSLRLGAYPVPRLTEIRLMAEQEDYYRAAVRLLGGSPLPDEAQLDDDKERASNHLYGEFNQERPTLAEYAPEMNDDGQVTFMLDHRVEAPGLLEFLANQIDIQKTLLDAEERSLFENFLLQEMAEAIRLHIGQTETWVQKINLILRDLPMVGERYALEWKPTEESDLPDGLGSHIARQHRLLRKSAQNLTNEESRILMDAFRREIENLRLRQKEEPGLNFMDALVQIFDYREWFHFAVYITPTGGNRIRLTDRNAGTRSGAEQLFALYVPLFAALAALYESVAAPGCPRLLALDEAFDKASLANTQRIMHFLVTQKFQWMMTGPQVSGMGSSIPVSTEYQMMHEKGSLVATAVPFYWIGGQST